MPVDIDIPEIIITYVIISYQLKLTKMRAELVNLNHRAVPFLSCAVVNLCGYCNIWINYQLFCDYMKPITITLSRCNFSCFEIAMQGFRLKDFTFLRYSLLIYSEYALLMIFGISSNFWFQFQQTFRLKEEDP